MPVLASLQQVSLELDGTGTLAIGQITRLIDSKVDLSGTDFAFTSLTDASGTDFVSEGIDVDLSALTNLSGGSITVNGGTIDLASIANINGASFIVNGGTALALPTISNYTHTNGTIADTATFRATGSGSVLDLSNLQTLTGGDGVNDQVVIIAESGGVVDLSSVTDLIDPSTGDLRSRAIRISSEGTGSLVDLSSLANFLDQSETTAQFGNPGLSELIANNLGIIRLHPVQTLLQNVTRSETNGGMIEGGGSSSRSLFSPIEKSSHEPYLRLDDSLSKIDSSSYSWFSSSSHLPELASYWDLDNIERNLKAIDSVFEDETTGRGLVGPDGVQST